MSHRLRSPRQTLDKAIRRAHAYREVLGEDIAGRLVHHAEKQLHHREAHEAELNRLRDAAREVGIRLPEVS